MMVSKPIDERQREILTAIVDTYISTGEPVGSRTLARLTAEGLSPATIRNVMADLADAGYLEQPHTSAGRVPTVQAFRFYVEQLNSRQEQLGVADRNMINESLQGASDTQDLLGRTSHLLSLLSRGVGVAVAVTGSKTALDHIHFSRLGENRVLAVLVTRGGVVSDRMLRVERDLAQGDLDVASRYINENFRGWTLDEIRAELERRIAAERSEYDRLMQSLEMLHRQGALETEGSQQTIFVEGAANLVAGEHDGERLRQLLHTLEEKEKLADLLQAYLNAEHGEVRVVIGLEDSLPHMRNFVLIGTPANIGGEQVGSLAVLGPTRIDYGHTITAVQYLARIFEQLAEGS
jgi:heat-inducible transcriptional repressor